MVEIKFIWMRGSILAELSLDCQAVLQLAGVWAGRGPSPMKPAVCQILCWSLLLGFIKIHLLKVLLRILTITQGEMND